MAAHVMIHINAEDLPAEGVRVLYRTGESFDGGIEWDEVQPGQLLPTPQANDRNEPGLLIDDDELE